MRDLLRDAFNHGWTAHIDFDILAGKHNGTIMRTWITKPAQIGGVLTASRRPSKRKKAKGARR